MCFVITDRAHSGAAAFTFRDLPAVLDGDVVGFDPVPTALADAIHLVFRFVFEELAVPRLLEILCEQLVNVFEVDMFLCAAARRHVCGICDGHFEDPPEAGMAHAVFAGEAGGFGKGHVVGAAC